MTVLRSCFIVLVVLSVSSCGSFDPFGDGGMGTDTIVAGLKEALNVGTGNAVSLTSAAGGFSNDAERFIGLPGILDDVGQALRLIGKGDLINDLERGMNVAAEHASAHAAPVFLDAIKQMTFADARNILQGSDTAATDYFSEKTRPGLTSVYGPIVRAEMDKVGVVKQYNDLIDTFTSMPFTTKPDFSVENYVTGKALDGLFSVLATEEQKIRADPMARVTPLLQKVFGMQ